MINTIDIFNFIDPSFITKFGVLFANFFLIIFLLVVWKQVSSMNKIITDANDAAFVKSLAIILLVIAVSLFLVTIVIL